jgi:hypothetical protein
MEYREGQLKEILFLIREGFSYNDVLSMPVYIRKYYIDYIIEMKNK